MKLFFDGEGGARGAFPLNGAKVTIGRSSECDIVLADDRVSRQHAYLENVAGQILVQDLESSNGTFLNGMRLRPQTGCALREGDVLEIGATRFLCSSDAVPDRIAPEAVAELSDGSFPLLDLLRDGAPRSADAAAERAEFLRAFVGVSPIVGLERCLDVVARRLGVEGVAVFMRGLGEALQPMASRPAEASRGLASIAQRAWTSGEGRLIRGFVGGADLGQLRETTVRPLYSGGAVPFGDGDVRLGVLAVERVNEKRLDRVELAALAAMGDAIAQTLALGDRNPEDTRLGLAATIEVSAVEPAPAAPSARTA